MRWKLVDEAERTVVVAGADLIEERRRHLGPERLPGRLGNIQHQLEAAAPDLDRDVLVVREQTPLDDVARNLAVDAQHLVAHLQPGPCRRRRGRDGDDPRWLVCGRARQRRSRTGGHGTRV